MRALLENPFAPNPRRRRRRRKSTRRRTTRSRRRRNPANPAPNPRRRRRSRRRATTRRSRRRSNPFRLGGGRGLVGKVMSAVGPGVQMFGGLWVVDFLRTIAYRWVPMPAEGMARNAAKGGVALAVGLVLGHVLRRFGGPLRPLAPMAVAAGAYRLIYELMPSGAALSGAGAAYRWGLGDVGDFRVEPEAALGADWSENQLLGLAGYIGPEGSVDQALVPAYP